MGLWEGGCGNGAVEGDVEWGCGNGAVGMGLWKGLWKGAVGRGLWKGLRNGAVGRWLRKGAAEWGCGERTEGAEVLAWQPQRHLPQRLAHNTRAAHIGPNPLARLRVKGACALGAAKERGRAPMPVRTPLRRRRRRGSAW